MFTRLLLAILACTPLLAEDPKPLLPPDLAAGYTLAWRNEFDGDQLNTAEWSIRTGARFASENTKGNVSIDQGWLRLAVRKEKAGPLDYTAGGVISKKEHKYGYYEARFRVPRGAGWHTSFWMMKNTGGQTGNRQEIDVIEQDSKDLTSYGKLK